MDESGASETVETVVSLNLPTWTALRPSTVSSFTFYLTVSC
jgi:hypothetical protein